MRKAFVCVVILLAAITAQPAGKFELTIDNIMRGPELVGYEPTDVRWSGDGERIYFHWKQASDPLLHDPDTYVVNREGGALRKLSLDEARSAPPASGDLSKDHKRIVYAREGDVYVYDQSTGQTKRLTHTNDIESSPHWLNDGQRVSFTRANNLYVLSLADASIEQLTDIRMPGAPAAAANGPAGRGPAAAAATTPTEEQKGTDSQEFLKKEEKDLLLVVRERAAKRAEDKAERERENPRKPFTLAARQSVGNLQLSPDETLVTASIVEREEKTKNAIVPNFVTESAYTEDISSRNKVGDVQNKTKLAILGVRTGEVKWVEHGQKGEVQLSQPVWSEDGTRAALQARAADNKDRWILALDAATGKTRVLVDNHDNAWVDGPGAFTLGWLKSDRDLYFQSERSGYSQLYSVGFDGGEAKALTSGDFEVVSAVLSRDKSKFLLTTSEADPGEEQIYEMPAEGGKRVRLTRMTGGHRVVVSPDERWMADVYSYSNKPPELYSGEVKADAKETKLTASPAPEFSQYPWLDVPIITFAARDGAKVRAHIYKPANFKKGGPAVIFVHGAGYLQNVHRHWSSYSHEYMFNQLLMERGYLVLDIDYRGSAGYGRDWRTAIYEHMGGKDLEDNVDAARWLVSQHGVDAKRIGLYGGSYGGFITLMAMFTTPDVFTAGAALRPVTDWAHYNHPYTSNILNNPQSDAEAYRRSSPIYFAQNLKGALLICHGMVDTNVHFQDTVRLVQRLIELRKENWQVAVFPVEDHGFIQPTSWADEYKRILALFDANLKK
jgi:dipeptidyl aminopeptidase/acylaminoacyl peptidase